VTPAAIGAQVRDWVFDLDNTLYPADSTLYDVIGRRMTEYVARATSLPFDDAEKLQERYFMQYGATVVGLVRHHAINAADFLNHVHDVDASMLTPDRDLDALLERLPGRKIVFTNGGGGHAERVIEQLGLTRHFDILFDIETAALAPKPQREAYERLIAYAAIDPARAVLIEDTLRNLEPAHALGFLTVLVGPVHPDPAPAYVNHCAHDLKAFLREACTAPRARA
jgi:putative hydrolase of the HAD superfamily